jgi:RHS repeat-associated protein
VTLYYGYLDYQGNLIALANEAGTVVENGRFAYDPWGKRRNPADWTQDDTRISWIVSRGYTMHEHLDMFSIINMNGRVYDPLTSMFFSPDPFVQAPDNWLNYNRYGYAFGNPMKYTDPNGEWIHLVVGAVVGGVINWMSNGCEFTWEGLSYFGTGAVAGLITAAAPGSYALVAAGLSAANNVFQQGYNPGIGFKNLNLEQVLFQGVMGGLTAYAGGEFGKALQVDKWVAGIESPLLRSLSQNLITNTIVGGTFGGLSSVSNGGDFWEGAWSGVKMGMVTGTISGLGGAVTYAKENNVNILSGKPNSEITKPVTSKPNQNHHFATDKNKQFSPEMQRIAEEFGLNLNDDWNTMSLPHQGRHPNAYHRWVLENMYEIRNTPNMNPDLFKLQFNQRVIQPVMSNPNMLYKNFWTNGR